MYKLSQASISTRKAAMRYYRIGQGLYRPMFNGEVIAIVFNNRHPEGVKITKEMAKSAALMTWEEIKG